MSYAFTPVPDTGYIAKLRDSLKPGGLLVFEHYQVTSFHVPGATRTGEAAKAFRAFKILKCEESVTRGDWQFQRKQPLVRLVAAR
jgi:hypothetical protein